jgi:hypothetical protein
MISGPLAVPSSLEPIKEQTFVSAAVIIVVFFLGFLSFVAPYSYSSKDSRRADKGLASEPKKQTTKYRPGDDETVGALATALPFRHFVD